MTIGRRWLRRARNRLIRKAIILLYHRIGEPGLDPWRLAVSPRRFAEQLEVLCSDAEPVSLGRLVPGSPGSSIPDRAVVVTFDDGYADNFHRAKPLLEMHGVPATVFVTSGQLGLDEEFWWDELERTLLLPWRLPERLRLRVRSEDREWAIPREPGRSRLDMYRSVWKALLPLEYDERRALLERLRLWAAVPAATRTEYRAMTPEDVVGLGQGGLIEIGAHTLTHPLMSSRDLASREREIRGSKRALEELLGHAIDAFSYPHGDFDEVTTRLVKEAGFRIACTVEPEVVWWGSDALRLPRHVVEDWGAEEFRSRLSGWFSG